MAKNKKKEQEVDVEEVINDNEPEITVIDEDAEQQNDLNEELERLQDQLLRQAAEYDNYRKRTAKERSELGPEITAKVVTKFLPVIDNLERALAAECTDENFRKGVEMIYESFLTTLADLGVEVIETVDFNPAYHQAVQQVESDELESGKIAATFQKGYKMGERIVRFAMVSVVS